MMCVYPMRHEVARLIYGWLSPVLPPSLGNACCRVRRRFIYYRPISVSGDKECVNLREGSVNVSDRSAAFQAARGRLEGGAPGGVLRRSWGRSAALLGAFCGAPSANCAIISPTGLGGAPARGRDMSRPYDASCPARYMRPTASHRPTYARRMRSHASFVICNSSFVILKEFPCK